MGTYAKGEAQSAMRHAAATVKRQGQSKILDVGEALKDLRQINPEIRYKGCFEAGAFTSGLIAFRTRQTSDPKQIKHADKDVVCYVIKGRGRLRLNRRRIELRPGLICHIPKGQPHDFAAGKSGELILFYSLIKTA
jgi:quercetin dioxygenase-like cupin family protein